MNVRTSPVSTKARFDRQGRRWILGFLVLLPVPSSLGAQTPLAIPRVDAITVDGSTEEWSSASRLLLAPATDQVGLRVQGDFEPDDVRADLRLRWDAKALYAAIEWQDDLRDTGAITFETMMWPIPGVEDSLDRLYLFDGLVLRFFRQDRTYLYAVLVAPRIDGTGPYQWDMLRIGGEHPDRREELRATRAAATTDADGLVRIELAVPWSKLEIEPRAGLDFDLRLALPDSDCPGLTLEEKWAQRKRCMKSLRWRGQAVLE